MKSFNVTIFGDPFSGKSSLLKTLIDKTQDFELKREFYQLTSPSKQDKMCFNIFESTNYLKKMTNTAERILSSDILIIAFSYNEKENEFFASNFPKTNELDIKIKKKLYNSVVQIVLQMAVFFNFSQNLIFVITKCEHEIVDTLNDRIEFLKNKFESYLKGIGVHVSANSIIPVSSLNNQNVLNAPELFSAECTLMESILLKGKCIIQNRESLISEKFRPTRVSVISSYKKLGVGIVAEGFSVGNDFKIGDEVLILPVNKTTKIGAIEFYNQPVQKTHRGGAFGFNLKGISQKDLGRGSMICKVGHNSNESIELKSVLVHLYFVYAFNFVNKGFVLSFITYNSKVPCVIDEIYEILDFETVTNEWEYGNSVIGTFLVAKLDFLKPIFVERYQEFEFFGRFALVGSNIVYALGKIESLNPANKT